MEGKEAKRLTILVDEGDSWHGRPVYKALTDLLYEKRLAGVSVFRGVAGYGGDRVFHTAKIVDLSASLPLMIVVIDTAEMIASVLPELLRIVQKGLVEVSDTVVLKGLEKREP